MNDDNDPGQANEGHHAEIIDERPPLPADATRWQRFRYHARPSIALGIVVVSVLAAIMTYRASLAEEEGSRAVNISGQQEIQREAALSTDHAIVDQDLRVFGRIQEHLLLSERLREEAEHATGQKAQDLFVESQRELALARREQSFVEAAGYDGTGDKPHYNVRLARSQIIASDQDLQRLAIDELNKEAKVAHIRTVRLVGLAALFVVALFFLALAEANTGVLRRSFVAIGVTVTLGACIAAGFA